MHALVLQDGRLRVRSDHPLPQSATETTIRLRQGGICATDLELVKGYMGFEGVLGHEWVGVVSSSPQSKWVGRRVVGDINCPCMVCSTCAAGRYTHCPNRTVLGIQGRNGAFSEYFQLPAANLHEVPENVSDDAAVFVEPLAAALRIVEQLHIRPSQLVYVLGVGRLGQLCARVLALTGAKVCGISRGPERLHFLPDGVEGVLLADIDKEPKADVVIDCTGNPEGLAIASSLARSQGTIVLKTTVHLAKAVNPTSWVIDEQRVIGSRCGPFAPALRLLASGAIDPTPLISARFPLSDGLSAMRKAVQKDAMKVILKAK